MASKPTKPEPMFQTVLLTFSDGTKAAFTGSAVAYKGDTRKIVGILFTEPKPLPPGCSLEPLEAA